jgi:cation diffusion facilitator family transporter
MADISEGGGLGSYQAAFRAGALSVGLGFVILGLKFAAWVVTGATVLLADAAESIINVIAAAMATYSVALAARPADPQHPYGHGKAEALSAAVEGVMIGVAATVIVVESVRQIVTGPELEKLGTGIIVAGIAGAGNLLLGIYLVRVGRRERSEAIQADGTHILTDVVTTAGGIVALIAVHLTGFTLLDPIVALLVAANILVAGWKVARRALTGLLDEADFEFISQIAAHLEGQRCPEWIEIHQLRARRAGRGHHVDLHLTVPRYFSIETAHEAGDAVEILLRDFEVEPGAAVVHLDPCLPGNCPSCVVADCAVRSAPLRKQHPFDVQSLIKPGPI